MIIFRDVWNLTKVQWLDYTLPGTDISYPLIFRGVQHKAGSKLHVPSMFLSTKGGHLGPFNAHRFFLWAVEPKRRTGTRFSLFNSKGNKPRRK